MRIFLIGAAPAPDTMEKHVQVALGQMGHTVGMFNARDIIGAGVPAKKLVNALVARFAREPERTHERRIVRTLAEFQPDLVLALLGSMLSPKTIGLVLLFAVVGIDCQ